MTLDTAVLFNIIPERYTKLGLSALDTYLPWQEGIREQPEMSRHLP